MMLLRKGEKERKENCCYFFYLSQFIEDEKNTNYSSLFFDFEIWD